MRRREQACNIERLDLYDNDKIAMLTYEGLRIQKLEYGPEKVEVEVATTLENYGIASTCISNGSIESWEVRTRQMHV